MTPDEKRAAMIELVQNTTNAVIDDLFHVMFGEPPPSNPYEKVTTEGYYRGETFYVLLDNWTRGENPRPIIPPRMPEESDA